MAVALLSACGGSDGSLGSGAPGVTVGGTVTGLVTGANVELQNNAADTATVSANGSYSFSYPLTNGSRYDVTVSQQPAGEKCSVSNGSGAVDAVKVANILVACTPNDYTVSGTLSGLLSGRSLVVQDNGGDSATLSAGGGFSFSIPVPSGANYAVTILSQPAGQSCAVSHGSGIIAAADVSSVAVRCSDDTYNVGVTVAGVSAGGLVLQDNAADNLSVAANGFFDFNTPIASGSAYAVTLLSQPLGENCTVGNPSGTIVSSNVSNVTVSCIANDYPVGGTLSGLLVGRSVVLQDNGGNSTPLFANGAFVFSTQVASGRNYSVIVFSQPSGQTCSTTNGSGIVAGAAVSNVGVACSDNSYNVGVAVSGLISGGLVLQDNGGDNLTVAANDSFNFATPVASGSTYTVTVLAQPAGETCSVTNGTGTVLAANIVGIPVTCTPISYSIGGSLTGLLPNNSVVLEDNGGNSTTLSANGSYTFSGLIASGSSYAVTVSADPAGQTCAVSNGSGTVISGNVTSVGVACSDNTYNIGVTVTGVNASGLVLQDNGGDNLTINTDGSANFATPIASGSPYDVSLLSQPTGETCTLGAATGTVSSSNVNVAVGCTPNFYTVSGAVSGLLNGNGVMLQDNGGDTTTVSANSGFSFAISIASGSSYAVTISAQPPGQTCSVSNGSGTIAGADIGNVGIACSDNNYNIGVTVTGLSAGGLVLQDNGGDNLAVGTNGSVNFATPIASGSSYAVSVLSQPTGQTCTITGGSGIVTSADVAGIPVSCVTNTYAISGNVTGLKPGSLVLQNNGADNLNVAANGSFTFATPIISAGDYAVTVLTQPQGQTCTVTNGTGTVAAAAVSNVLVICNETWTWVGGSSGNNAGGVYGSQAVVSTGNIPGARLSAMNWSDASGNLWMFGGIGYDSTDTSGFLNDLWKFNPAVGSWTWVGGSNAVNSDGFYGTLGVASTNNAPGARAAGMSWIDASGNLWLFGGSGYTPSGGGYLNDLWKFNPAAGTSEWVSGANAPGASGTYGIQGVASTGNAPGARVQATCWTDASGNLWLFGGYGYDSSGTLGLLNDLWTFNPAAATWEWVSGSATINASGVYGTLGVASTSNLPGARIGASSWTDSSGNFWLFGGGGPLHNMNDLWEFNPTTGTWTWVNGPNTGGSNGVYGTRGVASTSNVPPSRNSAASWSDASGNLWLFGGGDFNDLWEFSPAAGTWEWVGGSNAAGAAGVYGTQGVASTNNVPGARQEAMSWTDASGNLWLFGGSDASGNEFFNDVWEFVP